MKPKVDGTFELSPEQAEDLRSRVNARFKQHKASERSAAKDGGPTPGGLRRLHFAGEFASKRDRDDFWAWVASVVGGVQPPGFAHFTRHDCGEDEPEPVHLPYEALAYQEWRASRNCRARDFEEIRIGVPEEVS